MDECQGLQSCAVTWCNCQKATGCEHKIVLMDVAVKWMFEKLCYRSDNLEADQGLLLKVEKCRGTVKRRLQTCLSNGCYLKPKAAIYCIGA